MKKITNFWIEMYSKVTVVDLTGDDVKVIEDVEVVVTQFNSPEKRKAAEKIEKVEKRMKETVEEKNDEQIDAVEPEAKAVVDFQSFKNFF